MALSVSAGLPTVEHNFSVCLYIAYIACGSASLYIKTLYFFPTVLALSAAVIVANIKIRYDVKTPQFAIFGTRVIYVFYSVSVGMLYSQSLTDWPGVYALIMEMKALARISKLHVRYGQSLHPKIMLG